MITTARYGNMFGEEVLAEVFKNSDIFIEKFSWVFSDKYHIQREFEIFEEIDNKGVLAPFFSIATSLIIIPLASKTNSLEA